jgi:hypothetical protein
MNPDYVFETLTVLRSVADPGCLSRIRLFPSRIRIKEFKYFNTKKWSKLYELLYGLFIPDPVSGC